MSEKTTLDAEIRQTAGKSSARALRKSGKIPAIIYGGGDSEISIALEQNLVEKHYRAGRFFVRIFSVKLDGKEVMVLPRDIQLHPVNELPQHVDFLRIKEGQEVCVKVGVRFTNTEQCKGLKRGGTLNVVRRQIEVFAPSDNIPDVIKVDIEHLRVGESVHADKAEFPEGVRPVLQRNFTIATITGRGIKASDSDNDAEDESAE